MTAIELDVSGADPVQLRSALAIEAATQQVDVAVQPTGLYRRAKRLVVLDVDSTLIQGEVIEMLAAHAGCLEEVTRVTTEAMNGEARLRRVPAAAGRAARGRRRGRARTGAGRGPADTGRPDADRALSAGSATSSAS